MNAQMWYWLAVVALVLVWALWLIELLRARYWRARALSAEEAERDIRLKWALDKDRLQSFRDENKSLFAAWRRATNALRSIKQQLALSGTNPSKHFDEIIRLTDEGLKTQEYE